MSIFDKIAEYFKKGNDSPEVPESKAEEVVPLEPLQITKAKVWHGKKEVEDNAALYSLLGFDPASTAWCAGFVNAIEKQCGRKGTGKLTARSYLDYGRATSKPELGDIVVFKRGNSSWEGHVGYFIREDEHGILVLGGNQSNKVCYKYYPVASVLGYRRPCRSRGVNTDDML